MKRSYTKELLDRDDIPFDDIRLNMKELDFINTYLGGHHITIDGLKHIISGHRRSERELTIAEIGCGGGDNLLAIQKWSEKNNIATKVIGIDINGFCTQLATSKLKDSDSKFICSDYKLVDFDETKPDIIFSSLFCHHFTDEELVDMLKWMKQHSAMGFFINDLQRHPLAYHSIKLLSTLFSRSYLVKNDAPLSVLRGFRRGEWMKLLSSAGIKNYSLNWKWAFRYLVCVRNYENQ